MSQRLVTSSVVTTLIRSASGLAAAAALSACGNPAPVEPDAGAPLPGTYENVEMIMRTSCAFPSCHGGPSAGASMLNLERSIMAGTLREDLVDQPSCMYSAMPLVTEGDPDNSWLWLKVAGAHTGTQLTFTPDEGWDPGIVPDGSGRYPTSQCPLTQAGAITFGTMMPQGSMGLDASRAETIRLWIEAGAPGPTP